MRVLSLAVAMMVAGSVVTAQGPSSEPAGTLAQVMRGIFFPNSNIIFDVQARDPEAPAGENDDGTVSSTFASIYAGWPSIENAAISIAEGTTLLMLEGRLCQNGLDVPLADTEFVEYAREMEDVARAAAAVAATKDRDAMINATNDLAGGCENCHSAYRRYPEENRCQLP